MRDLMEWMNAIQKEFPEIEITFKKKSIETQADKVGKKKIA